MSVNRCRRCRSIDVDDIGFTPQYTLLTVNKKELKTKWRKTISRFSAIFTFFSYKNAPFLPHQVQEIPIFVLDIVFLNKKTLSTLLTTINLSINLSS